MLHSGYYMNIIKAQHTTDNYTDEGTWPKINRMCLLLWWLFHILSFSALASSAPIWQFKDLVPCDVFYKIVTDDFSESGKGCSESIRRSWKAVDNLTSTGTETAGANMMKSVPGYVSDQNQVLLHIITLHLVMCCEAIWVPCLWH